MRVCHVRHMMDCLKSILRLPRSTRQSTLVLYWTCAVKHVQQLLMFWYLILLVLLPSNIKTLQKTNHFTVTQKTVRLWFMSCMGVFFLSFFCTLKKSWPTVNYTNSKLYHLLEERKKVESRSMFMYLKNGV